MSLPEITEDAPERLAFSIVEAAAQISCGRSTLYSEIRAGRLRASKIRRRTVIRAEDLRAYLQDLRSMT